MNSGKPKKPTLDPYIGHEIPCAMGAIAGAYGVMWLLMTHFRIRNGYAFFGILLALAPLLLACGFLASAVFSTIVFLFRYIHWWLFHERMDVR
jgi:ABC-type polysaccharide/polyol phosphate export permease